MRAVDCRSPVVGGIAIGTEREYRGACEKHKRAKCPKGGFVGMQSLESQPHHVGSDSRTDDEAGEQVSVQLPETFHSEISGRKESDHVNFGAGFQAKTDDARDRRTRAVEQINSDTRE